MSSSTAELVDLDLTDGTLSVWLNRTKLPWGVYIERFRPQGTAIDSHIAAVARAHTYYVSTLTGVKGHDKWAFGVAPETLEASYQDALARRGPFAPRDR